MTTAMMMLSQEELSSVFSDMTPIPQDDGPNPVCSIDYSPQFRQAYDYMRAVLALGEKSGMHLFFCCTPMDLV
jgi:protein farnesyltransferase/geranylgeranyltransferase type-1 subunit alpha